MIHGQSFESYEASCQDYTIYSCDRCGRMYSPDTVGRMEDEALPCPGYKDDPCGERPELFTKLTEEDAELAVTDDLLTTYDEVVNLCVRSGFWRCRACLYTAPERLWAGKLVGDELVTVCPECDTWECYEIMTLDEEGEGDV